MSWQAIIGFRLVTADLDRATRFYQALGFSLGPRQPISAGELALLQLEGAGTRQALRLGPSHVDLDTFDRPGRPYPVDVDAASLLFQHLAIVTDAAGAAWDRARQAGATLISRQRPVTLPASAGGVTAVKFHDPDGHPLELLQFPDSAAKGWRGRGMLGIDHSAISVRDVATSSRFYEQRGLAREPSSLNHGPTQEALDGLDGAKVDVVPMRPGQEPPHLELLGYHRPQPRSSEPLAPNDIPATRMVWRAGVRDLVRDPDGHWHQLEAD